MLSLSTQETGGKTQNPGRGRQDTECEMQDAECGRLAENAGCKPAWCCTWCMGTCSQPRPDAGPRDTLDDVRFFSGQLASYGSVLIGAGVSVATPHETTMSAV
jgi:hypothetical protein